MIEENRRTVRLNVPEANARARSFYERRGWRITCRLPRADAWLGFPMLRYARSIT
jgi:ribosomal protein S18 acetylase RimI-like enzyme